MVVGVIFVVVIAVLDDVTVVAVDSQSQQSPTCKDQRVFVDRGSATQLIETRAGQSMSCVLQTGGDDIACA